MAKRSELMVIGTPVVLKASVAMGIPEQKGTIESPWESRQCQVDCGGRGVVGPHRQRMVLVQA